MSRSGNNGSTELSSWRSVARPNPADDMEMGSLRVPPTRNSLTPSSSGELPPYSAGAGYPKIGQRKNGKSNDAYVDDDSASSVDKVGSVCECAMSWITIFRQ